MSVGLLNTICAEQGWSESTLISLMNDFVESRNLSNDLVDFLSENQSEESLEEHHGIIGLDDALDELKDSENQKLYNVEMGIFEQEDTNTPVEVFNVAVLISSLDENFILKIAMLKIKDAVSLNSNQFFSRINDIEELDKDDF